MARGTPVVLQGCTRGKKRQLDLYSGELFIQVALATEGLREWLLVSTRRDCLTGTDGLYNPLLLGAVNDTKYSAANTMAFILDA